jgi:hypothetical protein
MDITNEEFIKIYLTTLENDNTKASTHKRVSYPASVDWTTTEGKV